MDLELDGYSLTAAQVVRTARQRQEDGTWPQARLSPQSRAKLERTRDYIEREWVRPDAPPIYGFNTGGGKLKDSAIAVEQIDLVPEIRDPELDE